MGMTQRESYWECCLNWGLWTCSTFVHVLLFFLVQPAESDNIKINQLFFPYCINNHNSRTKWRSSKPKPHFAEVHWCFPTMCPCPLSEGLAAWPGVFLGHGGVMALSHWRFLLHSRLSLSLRLPHFVHKAACNWVFDKEVFTSSVSCA